MARIFYRSRETEARYHEHVDVVLVVPDALEELRRAYPNYFLDARFFVETVRESCRRIVKAD